MSVCGSCDNIGCPCLRVWVVVVLTHVINQSIIGAAYRKSDQQLTIKTGG